MKNLSYYLSQTTRLLFYFLFIVLPLVWTPVTSELFEFPKMIFVYILTTLITSTWVINMIIQKKILFKKTFFDFPIILFLISQTISTVLSIHPRTSFFGYYSRHHGGLLSIVCYSLLYWTLINNFTQKHLKPLLLSLITGIILASLYALPEHFGHSFSCLAVHSKFDVTCWIQDVQTRIFGTFGQPNWLAAYIITLFPFLWYHLFSLKKNSKPLIAGNLLVQVLLTLVLTYSKSRSGLVGLFAALLIFVVALFIKKPKKILSPKTLTFSLPIITILIAGSAYFPSIAERIRSATKQPIAQSNTAPTGTVLDSGELGLPTFQPSGGTQSSKIREIVWRGAIANFLHYPIFGSGTETFAYSYYNFRPVEHNLVSEWDFLYNKAHNEFLNFLATTGIFGFTSYAIFLLFILIKAFLIYSSVPKKNLNYLFPIAIFSEITALSLSNFFGFSTVGVGVLLYTLPALLTLSSNPKESTRTPNLTLIQISLIGIVSIISLVLVVYFSRMFIADITYSQAQKAESQNQYFLAQQKYQRALDLFPHEPTFLNDYADSMSKLAYVYATQGDNAQTVATAQKAFQLSADTLKGNPRHLNFYKTQAGVYIRLSVFDQNLLHDAETILRDAFMLAPTDAKLAYNLGLIQLDLNNSEEAKSYFQQAVDLKPNYETARLELAKILLNENNHQSAKSHYEFILNYINPQNQTAIDQLDLINSSGTSPQ